MDELKINNERETVMYIINISINLDKVRENQLPELLTKHQAWFTKYFDEGFFLIIGPYLDWQGAGVILAKAGSRDGLEKILSEDVFYAEGLAVYDVHEFKAVKVAVRIQEEI